MSERIITVGPHEQQTIDQLERCVLPYEGARGALMADGHLGYSAPIGGVMAYPYHVSPSGVGYDIGCGNLAVQTALYEADIAAILPQLADAIEARVAFGIGQHNTEAVADTTIIDKILGSHIREVRALHQKAANQLGTVGGGNHYVDVFADENGRVWIGVHFGSRGFGHSVATGFLNLAAGRAFKDKLPGESMHAEPTLIKATSQLGEAYIHAMELAGEYADAGRRAAVQTVLDILGTAGIDVVSNHHNYAWREYHDGIGYWVVRKGATPAFEGQRGFVGSSMGENSVILEGTGQGGADLLLQSTVHGAGRAMSRIKAGGKTKRRKRWGCPDRDCDYERPAGEQKPETCPIHGHRLGKFWREEQTTKGVVNWPLVTNTLKQQGIELRGGGADEAPQAYKRLDQVLPEQGDTVKVLHTLRPLIVVMAPRGVPADD